MSTNLAHYVHDKRPSKAWLARHESHVNRWHLDSPYLKSDVRNPLPVALSHFFHPTRATFVEEHGDGDGMTQSWSSRAHRKHRYVYKSTLTDAVRQKDDMWGKIVRMHKFEYWNISWWVAQAFTWGSVVWVINGFAIFLPFCNSHFEEAPHSTGWTAFIGATIFEIGSIFGVLEVWNADMMAFEEVEHENPATPDARAGIESGKQLEEGQAMDLSKPNSAHSLKHGNVRPKWVWFSTDLKYWHELGWYAAFFQLLAASIFWISGYTAIPTIQAAIKPQTGVLDGIFWVPQVVGGSGFIISSTFIMLEAQHVWWKPRPQSIGWQVGFWNFVGGVGFTLSGAFGFSTAHWAMYQSALSTFWGGWAFLIGSLIQWYESVNTK